MPLVKVKKLHPDAKMPTKATDGSACWDVYSIETLKLTKVPRLVSTGLALEVSEGNFIDIRPRSGLATKGVSIVNSPGTIDSDYRGEVRVILVNLGNEAFTVNNGDRIAQMVFKNIVRGSWEIVESLPETARGEGGFGSTGVSLKDNKSR